MNFVTFRSGGDTDLVQRMLGVSEAAFMGGLEAGSVELFNRLASWWWWMWRGHLLFSFFFFFFLKKVLSFTLRFIKNIVSLSLLDKKKK